MQSLQAQHSALSQTERIKEETFSDTKENNENGSKISFQAAPLYMQDEAREKALAALLQGCRRAREGSQENTQETQNSEPKSEENKEDKEEEESSMDTSSMPEIPQIAIKPVEVLPAPAITSKALELNIPSAASEISAQ